MSHLSLETIARLIDEEPAAADAAHLASCAVCRAQLEAMSEDVHALALLPDIAAAPDQWDALERRLSAEGLLRTRAQRFGVTAVRMMQIAAAVTLFVGGTVAGRMTAPPDARLAVADPVTPEVPRSPVTEPSQSPVAEPSQSAEGPPSVIGQPSPRGQTVSGPRQDLSNPSVALALSGFPTSQPATMDEAAIYLREMEARYLDALTSYAELASDTDAGDLIARLAALQSIVLTTQAALNETPTDPVINGYHLTALAQRDAAIRQVAAASSDVWY